MDSLDLRQLKFVADNVDTLVPIVRDLAEMHSVTDPDTDICLLCGKRAYENPESHEPTCVWRRAREWMLSPNMS